MKNRFLIIAILLFGISGVAQTDSLTKLGPNEIFPSFPGGQEALMKFLKGNLKYPEKEKKENITGECLIAFVVEKNGSISSVRVLKGIPNGIGLDNEAIRVVKLLPNWNPGMIDGKPVRVQFTLPVKFSLSKKKKKKLFNTKAIQFR